MEEASASESVIEILDPEELARAAERGESPREVVAPYKAGQHIDDPWKSPFLSWIEASLGADKRPRRFVTHENPEVEMGGVGTKRKGYFRMIYNAFFNFLGLFEDMSD